MGAVSEIMGTYVRDGAEFDVRVSVEYADESQRTKAAEALIELLDHLRYNQDAKRQNREWLNGVRTRLGLGAV